MMVDPRLDPADIQESLRFEMTRGSQVLIRRGIPAA